MDVRTYASRPSNQPELIERIRDAEFVINVRARTRFSREVLRSCPQLRLVSIWEPGPPTSISRLPESSEFALRIRQECPIAVAEHALTLMLAAARQIVQVDQQVRAGQWPRAMVPQVAVKRSD
jgi:D-3-phosphoglycerate dehydrogenase